MTKKYYLDYINGSGVCHFPTLEFGFNDVQEWRLLDQKAISEVSKIEFENGFLRLFTVESGKKRIVAEVI